MNQIDDFILDEMDRYEADGVDFVPIFTTPEMLYRGEGKIIKTYSRDEWINSDGGYPRSGRLYWRKDPAGNKFYIY